MSLIQSCDFSPLGLSINRCPSIKRQYSGDLLIVGSGRCVWDDLDKNYPNNGEYYRTPDVMCLNDIVMHFPGVVTHAYSNDHKMLPRWVAARRPRYTIELTSNILQHSCNEAQHVWPWPGTGSSGLNAVYTGLALGYDNITLAGIPLNDGGHYFDPAWKKTTFTKQVPEKDGSVKYWQFAIDKIFNGKVKTISTMRNLRWI